MKRFIVIGFLVLLLFSVVACEKSPAEKYKEFSEEMVAEFGKQLATEQSYIGQSIERSNKVKVYENLFELSNQSLHKAMTADVPEQYKDAHDYMISSFEKIGDYYAGAAFFQAQWIQIEADLENLQNQLEMGMIPPSRIDYYKEQKVEPQEERALVLEQLKTDAITEMDNHLKFLE